MLTRPSFMVVRSGGARTPAFWRFAIWSLVRLSGRPIWSNKARLLARMIQLHDKVARLTGYARLPGISWATAACRRVVPERDCEAAIFKLGGQNGIGVDRDAAASQMMKSRKRVQ